jgi:hypothetical protein
MIIDGTNISTYGLRLLWLDDYYDLPARKKILPVPEFTENDIKYTSRNPAIKLFGKYESKTAMNTAINNFITLLKGSLVHTIELTNHGLSFSGVFKDGMKTTIRKNTVEIRFKITIVEA